MDGASCRLVVAVLHLGDGRLGGERLGRVVGRVQADEEVVNQQRGRPVPEAHERLGVDGAQEEDVDGDGRRRQPRHQRHAPQLGRPGLRHERPQAHRGHEPRGHRHRVRHPPVDVDAPARRRRRRRGEDGGDARRQLVPVGGRGLPGDVVAADQQRDGDELEDEERGDGEEVGEDAEVGEEGDDGGGDEHDDGGVDGRPRARVHLREPRRHHVRPGDVREVPRLADGADEQHGGHALERAEGDDVLGPVHAPGGEGHGEGRVGVDGRVGLHQAERDGEHAVERGGERHGADEADGDVPRRVLGLLRHGAHGVEADVGEEEHGGRREDAADAEGHEVPHVGGVGLGEPGHDDEDDDGDVDDGEDVVEAGGALGAGRGEDADERDDGHGDGVQLRVVGVQPRRVDAEVAGLVVQQRGEVGRPGARHGRAADAVLQQDVACRHERHEVAQLHAQVGERST